MTNIVLNDPVVIHGVNYRLRYPFWPYGFNVQEMGAGLFIGFPHSRLGMAQISRRLPNGLLSRPRKRRGRLLAVVGNVSPSNDVPAASIRTESSSCFYPPFASFLSLDVCRRTTAGATAETRT